MFQLSLKRVAYATVKTKYITSLAVLVFAGVGTLLLVSSHASTITASVESENGSLSGGVSTVTDGTASAGRAIKFGSKSSVSGFVTVCGKQLCLNGSTWYLYAGSVYNGLANPQQTITEATDAKLNTIRITDFIDTSAGVAGSTDESHWIKVDALIALAAQHNLKVMLDLSTFRNMLKKSTINPYTYDWQTFLHFVTNRINTVSGLRYNADPTIATIALAGEVDPPNGSNNTLGVTGQQVTDFFSRTLAQIGVLDTNHLRTSGGLLQLDWNSGIDWHTIMADPNDQICNIHDYSQADMNITGTIAQYCAGLNKPWITEEFGFNQTDGDSTRANEFNAMYSLQKTNNGAGVGFWNLGSEIIGSNGKTSTFDVNASTPMTLQAVQNNAPL